MFGFKPPYQEPGKPITARSLNIIFDIVGKLTRLTVGSGLSLKEINGAPVINLDGDFRIRHAVTTSLVTAYDDPTMGRGTIKFRRSLDGEMSDSGVEDIDVLNFTDGEVDEGTRCLVAFVDGSFVLIAANCPASGSYGA